MQYSGIKLKKAIYICALLPLRLAAKNLTDVYCFLFSSAFSLLVLAAITNTKALTLMKQK